jgi:predicted DNA-binding transcriptional regulator YafY
MTYLTDLNSDCGDEVYYDQKIGRYLKAVFEEYARLSYYKREQLFFQNTINIAKAAIKSRKRLKITIIASSGRQDKYDVRPHSVITDRQSLYNYLTGFSSRIVKDGENISKPKPASFRISRIKEIKVQSKSGKITEIQKAEIVNQLIKKGPSFLVGDVESIKIKLTDAGKQFYRRQFFLRPPYDEILADDIYVFHCSEGQIRSYFIKFGKNAQIIEPLSLKEYFLDFYSEACQTYS